MKKCVFGLLFITCLLLMPINISAIMIYDEGNANASEGSVGIEEGQSIPPSTRTGEGEIKIYEEPGVYMPSIYDKPVSGDPDATVTNTDNDNKIDITGLEPISDTEFRITNTQEDKSLEGELLYSTQELASSGGGSFLYLIYTGVASLILGCIAVYFIKFRKRNI